MKYKKKDHIVRPVSIFAEIEEIDTPNTFFDIERA